MTKADQTYLDTLLRYYEEEIEGEAYFAAIAERLEDPEQKRKMQMLADVETYAAAAVQPLLEKYALPTAPAISRISWPSGAKAFPAISMILSVSRRWPHLRICHR